jgi:hypothetical protein
LPQTRADDVWLPCGVPDGLVWRPSAGREQGLNYTNATEDNMSGKLKADYTTGETQVILPADFLNLPRDIREAVLKNWVQNLIDQLNATLEHKTAVLDKVAVEQDEAQEQTQEVAAEQEDVPLPPTDKPKRGKKASKE